MNRAEGQLWETLARELAKRHAAHLKQLGPVRVLACDPCPHCWGNVIASETTATCTSCSWRYQEPQAEPVASRRADA